MQVVTEAILGVAALAILTAPLPAFQTSNAAAGGPAGADLLRIVLKYMVAATTSRRLIEENADPGKAPVPPDDPDQSNNPPAADSGPVADDPAAPMPSDAPKPDEKDSPPPQDGGPVPDENGRVAPPGEPVPE